MRHVSEVDDDEPNTVAKIVHHQDEIKKLKDKEKTLMAIKAKCDNLGQHADVNPLTKALSDQLEATIDIIRKQYLITTEQIHILELHLLRLRQKPITPMSESTLGSSPMPEHEEIHTSLSLHTPEYPDDVVHMEQQTSFPLERAPIDTAEISIQTVKERKPTENIMVTQTTSEGHETIKFESVPNPNVLEHTEDVYVDAKYKQPNDPKKTTELVLRNVPQSSFETTFVEPDDTTTEVVIDPDGTKRIIVRKVTRTVKQQQIVTQQQHQQLTTISSVVGEGDEPIEQNVSQVNVQKQTTTTTVHDDSGSKTTSASQSRTSISTGESPDRLVVQEVIEHEPQISEFTSEGPMTVQQAIRPQQTVVTTELPSGVQQSSIQTVVQHVTQRVIRRRKQIIRRVVIIDGKEHVTEEVIELPEEIEETEDQIPGVNVNIVQTVSNEPIVELPVDETQQIQAAPITVVEPIAVSKTKKTKVPDTEKPRDKDKGKKKREQKQVKDDREKDSQVLDLESAPVELVVVEHAQIVADLPVGDVTNIQLAAKTSKETDSEPRAEGKIVVEQVIVTDQPPIKNIEEIWPPSAPTESPVSVHEVSQSISVSEPIQQQPEKEDSIKSQEIWPTDEKTGTPVVLEEYKFEKESPKESKEPSIASEAPIESTQIVETIEIDVVKPQVIEETIEITKVSETPLPVEESKPKEEVEIVKTTVEVEEIKPDEDVSEHTDKSSGTFTIESDEKPAKSSSSKDKKDKKASKSSESEKEPKSSGSKKETKSPESEKVPTSLDTEKESKSSESDKDGKKKDKKKKSIFSIFSKKKKSKESPVKDIPGQLDATSEFLAQEQYEVAEQPAEESKVEPTPPTKSESSVSEVVETTPKADISEKSEKEEETSQKSEPREFVRETTPLQVVEEVVISSEHLPQSDDDKSSPKIVQLQIKKTTEYFEPVVEPVETIVETIVETEKPSDVVIEAEKPAVVDEKQTNVPEGSIVVEEVRTVIETTKEPEPVIVIDKPETPSKSSSEQKVEQKPEKEQLKPKIDVRSATLAFIENELNVSDATTRTVKVSLPPKESGSPASAASVTVSMKVDSDVEQQPKLNVNIVEETVVVDDKSDSSKRSRKKKKKKEKTPTPVPSIDPSVAKSVDLDVEDDNTISEKMEMPEIETTPIVFDSKEPKQIEGIISPDESYQSIPSPDVIVKVIEEKVILDSPSPPPLPAAIIIATEIAEEQEVGDAEQQTSPIQFTEGEQKATERPIVDTRDAQTSPDEKQKEAATVSQQTSPIPKADQVEQENQTEVFSTTVQIQTSPVQIGDEQPTKEVVEQVSTEMQTDIAPIAQTSVQTEITVKEQEMQTSPRDEDKQTTVIASDIVPQVAEKLVGDVVQRIPIKVPTASGATNTEVITTTEIDTQTTKVPGQSEPSSTSEPYEIHIEASFTVPEDVVFESQQPGGQNIIEITKSFMIEEGKPPVVHEITSTSTDKDDKHPKKKSKKNKKGKKSTDQVDAAFLAQEKCEKPADAPSKQSQEQPTPEIGEIKITKTTEIYQPVISPEEKVETVIESADIPSESEIVSEVHLPSAPPLEPEDVVLETEKLVQKPTLITLDITRTTVYDTLNQVPADDKVNVEEKVGMQKKVKPQTSSVTIEEVLSPSEEDDVPVTPGADVEYSAPPTWSDQLKAVTKPTTQTVIESTSIPSQPQIDQQWQQTNHTINYRIDNINNARKAHLSNVLHLTSLGESVTPELVKQRAQTVQENLQRLDDATQRRNAVIIHTTVINTIEEISTWLETIEYRVYLNRQNSSEGPSEDKVEEFDQLLGELHEIDENVKQLSSHLNAAGDLVNPVEQQRMSECIDNLQKQLNAVEEVTKESNDETQNEMKRWIEYVTIVETITTIITEVQKRLETIQTDDTPISLRLLQLDDLENKNRAQITEISKSLQTARGLARDFPSKKFPIDIHATYEQARQLENSLNLEKGRLLQLQSLSGEYEQTLNEFAQIIVLAESIVAQPIVAKNLDQLQQEMQKHRKFFINLSHCRTILESLEENIDSESRKKHADLHKSLHDKATSILEKASERAQRISLAASRWTVLEKGLKDEKQWLQMAQQRVPDLSEVSTADYERYTTMYKSINSDIQQHHAKILQLSNIAMQLQDLVSAPQLEEESNDCLVALVRLRDELTVYLRRLASFRDIWLKYENQTDRLEQWIQQAERELARIEIPADRRSQPIENSRHFWEIRVHYEVNNNIRHDISNNLEKAIDVLPIRDELLQRQFHQQLEERWANVSNKINSVQDAIVNTLSDQEVPFNEKLILLRRELEELKLSIGSEKSIIKNEDELDIYTERMQVLNSRLNIIYNELGRLSLLPSNQPEQIGELFALSHNISIQVAEEIENSLILKESLGAIQQGINRLREAQHNSSTTLNACESSEKLGSDQIELAIADCQHVSAELQLQWQEIMRLRQLLHTLPMRLRVSVSPVKLERDLSQLQDDHAVLESQCAHILSLLKNRLVLWRRFERQLEIVQQSNSETEYMIDLLKINGQVDYERLRKATERLEVCIHFFLSRYLLYFYVNFTPTRRKPQVIT